MTIQSTDLFLVQRGNNPYNVDFETIKESLGPNDLPTFTRQSFTATEGQTVFICSDKFTEGQEMVYLNGSHMARNIDYTTGFNTRVTLVKPANVGDFLELTCGNYIETNPSGEPGDGRFLKLTGETSQAVDGEVQIDGDFDVSGDVGIGTDNPQAKLDITALAPGIADTITLGNYGNGATGNRIASKMALVLGADSLNNSGNTASYISFETDASEKVRISPSGNVGIGTDNPQSRLEVREDVDGGLGGVIRVSNYASNSPGSTAGIALQPTINTGRALEILAEQAATQTETDLVIKTCDRGAASEVFRITANGNVGIGTANPTNNLHLNGSSTTAVYGQITNASTGTTAGDGLLFGLDAQQNAIFWHQEDKAIRFATDNDEKVRIDNVGNFGIGTNDPQEKLDVDGTAKATIGVFGNITTSGNDITSSGGLNLVAGGTSALNFKSKNSYSDYRFFNKDGSSYATFRFNQITGNRTQTFPNKTGTIALTSDIPVVSGNYLSLASNAGDQTVQSTGDTSFSGNVGIGTDNPLARLHVAKSNLKELARFERINSGSIAHAFFVDTKSTTTVSAGCNINDFTVELDGNEKFRVKSDGDVGIGTTDPQAKLDVNGDIISNNVTFNLAPEDENNYTTTTETYTEEEEVTPYIPAVEAVVGPLGNVLVKGTDAVEATYQTVTKTRDVQTYTGPTYDVKDRLLKTDQALLALKQAAITATDFNSLQTAIVTALANI